MLDDSPDGWYRQLSIQFEDGSIQLLHIERKPTGTHIPLLRERPEPWTKLTCHKCPCCPLPDMLPSCPAAISLQTTMSKLRARKSTERVKATAIDSRGRSQTVEWPLQAVGGTLVQLAVFSSGCPVGRRLKPSLEGLPPFVTSLDLSRRIISLVLNRHGGSIDAARQELAQTIGPLHDVFTHLLKRFRADEASRVEPGKVQGLEVLARDAVPNSITQVDAFSQLLNVRANALLSQLSLELGWTKTPAESAAKPEAGGLWQKMRGLFGQGQA